MNIYKTRSRTPPPYSNNNKQPVITHFNRLYHVQPRNFNFKSRNMKHNDKVRTVDNNSNNKLHLRTHSIKHMNMKSCIHYNNNNNNNKRSLNWMNKKFKIVNENSFQFNNEHSYTNNYMVSDNDTTNTITQHALNKIANMRKKMQLCNNKNYQMITEVQKDLDMNWINNLHKDEIKYRNVNTSYNIRDNFNSYERVLFAQQDSSCNNNNNNNNRCKINIFPLLKKTKVNNSFQMYNLLHYNTKPTIQRNNNNNIKSKLKLNFFMNKDKIKNIKSKVSQYIHSHSHSHNHTNTNTNYN